MRHSGIDSLAPLAGMVSLAELDVGGNRIADLHPLTGLTGLAVLRADGNRIADLWPLAYLTGLETLDLGHNRVQYLQPLAGLVRLKTLQLDGNGLRSCIRFPSEKSLAELGLAGTPGESVAFGDGCLQRWTCAQLVGDLWHDRVAVTGLVHVGEADRERRTSRWRPRADRGGREDLSRPRRRRASTVDAR